MGRSVSASLSTITESVATERQVSSTEQMNSRLTIVTMLLNQSTEPWLSGQLIYTLFTAFFVASITVTLWQ